MRELKPGPPVAVPQPPFGDLVVGPGERVTEATYARVATADRERFKKVSAAPPEGAGEAADTDTTASDEAQTPE